VFLESITKSHWLSWSVRLIGSIADRQFFWDLFQWATDFQHNWSTFWKSCCHFLSTELNLHKRKAKKRLHSRHFPINDQREALATEFKHSFRDFFFPDLRDFFFSSEVP
jgi:hypothetical protein